MSDDRLVFLKSPLQQRVEAVLALLIGLAAGEAARRWVPPGPLAALPLLAGFLVVPPLGTWWLARRGAKRVTMAQRRQTHWEAEAHRSIIWTAAGAAVSFTVTLHLLMGFFNGRTLSEWLPGDPFYALVGSILGVVQALQARRRVEASAASHAQALHPNWGAIVSVHYAGWLIGTVPAAIASRWLPSPWGVLVLASGLPAGLLAIEIFRSIRREPWADSWDAPMSFGRVITGGLLLWGVPFGATMALIFATFTSGSAAVVVVFFCLVLGAVGGLAFGALMWCLFRAFDWTPRWMP